MTYQESAETVKQARLECSQVNASKSLLYDPARADKYKCPKCNHNLVMKAETPAKEEEYKQALAENKTALTEYEQLSAAKKRSAK